MAPRAYSSPIRTAQVERTRERLLDTARALLVEGGLDGLTLPKLAQAAGVSVPTVYRHFPTLDDLIRAFLEWIRPRIGQTEQRLMETPVPDLPALPLESFARFEAHARELLPLMESRAFNRVRVASMQGRARRAAALFAEHAPGWSARDLEAAAGAIYVLMAPQSWRWFRETWGIDTGDAARAASWAMRTLIEALGRHAGLGAPTRRRRR